MTLQDVSNLAAPWMLILLGILVVIVCMHAVFLRRPWRNYALWRDLANFSFTLSAFLLIVTLVSILLYGLPFLVRWL